MNSYQNKNEYEILDASQNNSTMSTRYPRYPLAKDPQASMQTTNYKDWLNLCDTPNMENPEFQSVGRSALSILINLSSRILSLLGIPFAAQIGQLWSYTLNLLWPVANNATQWEIFMRTIEELINARIETSVRNRALAELAGLGNILEDYKVVLQRWNLNPTNPTLQRDVVRQFEIVHAFFRFQMPVFAVDGFEVPLLPVYASAANLHLLLLRDVVINGARWGLESDVINDYHDLQLRLTSTYVDHCVTWYNTGLNRLIGTNARQWVTYNQFRREMTISVLDIISLFSNYDVRRYPTKTQSELTRMIYTDPIGTEGNQFIPGWVDNAPSFSVIENSVVRSPGAFTFLERVGIFTGFLHGWSSRSEFWSAHRLFSRPVLGWIWESVIFGNPQNNIGYQEVDFTNFDVFSINSRATSHMFPNGSARLFGVPRVTFDLSNVTNNNLAQRTYNRPFTFGGQDIVSRLPGETTEIPNSSNFSHRLAHISSFPVGNNGSVLSYGWTHRNVNRHNRLNPNSITQIPAIKFASGSARRGPGHTGGDLAIAQQHSGYQLFMQSPSAQRYRLRLRYAGISGGSISVSHRDENNQNILHSATFNVRATSGQLRYADFIYTDLEENTTLFETRNGVNLYRLMIFVSSGSILIDRIEYIPENTTTIEYEEERNLEKEKKAVDDLFTN
ncbi:insecticidal delta-endotoxin Cry8Ea1 family protein [Bacillus thuringiensis]|uniref:insecticidal delta-endotoxin Cry8Ea1 family protein n=1 Tax=Bacillus thuringiensis TaxID=1428 RepID=UPI002D7F9E4B|nr:insecticidal delta-endotoxin Cry8Ea1 family protein [Bacillus thuringiensis]